MKSHATKAVKSLMGSFPGLASPIRAALQPLNFRLYAVGAPKTGTMSIARLFQRDYRAMHEGTYLEAISYLMRRRAGTVSDDELVGWLLRRDVLIWADCESSHIMNWFADLLSVVYPDAKFLVTVRDCYSWTQSVLDQHLNSRPPRRVDDAPSTARGGVTYSSLRGVYYGDKSTDPNSLLTELGEYTLEGYLDYWSSHYAQALAALPTDRRMFVWTRDIQDRAEDIAQFVGVPSSSLDLGRSHSHVAPEKHDVLGQLDPQAVREAVRTRCGPVADRLATLPGLQGKDLLGLPT